MEISCNDCKNLKFTNCIDSFEYFCREKHAVEFSVHECADAKPKEIPSSADYKRGYMHGYNRCRNESIEAIRKCSMEIPEIVTNLD